MSVADVKQFVERWVADESLRSAVADDPGGVSKAYGFRIDVEAVRPLWDPDLRHLMDDIRERRRRFPLLAEYEDHVQDLAAEGPAQLAEQSTHPAFRSWRARQVARTASQFPKREHDGLLHVAAAFELSKGCSVGCWFCSESAPPLAGVFAYTPENARLWRGILERMQTILGPAAASGMCYWGTEPFDNPDYERFCADFHDVLGVFPRTTTAKPLDDPERTRRLLRTSLEKGCKHNRFSLLSIPAFDRLHREFTPEELLHVGVVYRGKGSQARVMRAGRAGLNADGNGVTYHTGTNACVSGFLINMVERSVRLITPCVPSAEWPSGYRVCDLSTFSDAQDLDGCVRRMIERHMPVSLPDDWLLKFRPDLQFEPTADGFTVSTQYMTRRFTGGPYVGELGRLIRKGNKTVAEAISILELYAVGADTLRRAASLALEQGVLDESYNGDGG